MFSFMKKKVETAPESAPQTSTETPAPAEESGGGLFARLRQSLSKTRTALADSLSSLILGRKTALLACIILMGILRKKIS